MSDPVSRYIDATVDDLILLRKIVTNSPYPEAEIHITEWSTSCEYLSEVADSLRKFTLTVPDTGVLELDVDLPPWAVMSLRQSA